MVGEDVALGEPEGAAVTEGTAEKDGRWEGWKVGCKQGMIGGECFTKTAQLNMGKICHLQSVVPDQGTAPSQRTRCSSIE